MRQCRCDYLRAGPRVPLQIRRIFPECYQQHQSEKREHYRALVGRKKRLGNGDDRNSNGENDRKLHEDDESAPRSIGGVDLPFLGIRERTPCEMIPQRLGAGDQAEDQWHRYQAADQHHHESHALGWHSDHVSDQYTEPVELDGHSNHDHRDECGIEHDDPEDPLRH